MGTPVLSCGEISWYVVWDFQENKIIRIPEILQKHILKNYLKRLQCKKNDKIYICTKEHVTYIELNWLVFSKRMSPTILTIPNLLTGTNDLLELYGFFRASFFSPLFMVVAIFLLQRWLEIMTKKSRKPPKCELCHFQYHRHKKFKVSSQSFNGFKLFQFKSVPVHDLYYHCRWLRRVKQIDDAKDLGA